MVNILSGTDAPSSNLSLSLTFCTTSFLLNVGFYLPLVPHFSVGTVSWATVIGEALAHTLSWHTPTDSGNCPQRPLQSPAGEPSQPTKGHDTASNPKPQSW